MAAIGRVIPVEFPAGGVDRALGFQNQRPFTTPDALNVRFRNQQDGRMIGGVRPGLVDFDPLVLGATGGSPIRMLNAVNVIPDSTALTHRQSFDDDFDDPTPAGFQFGHYQRFGNFFETVLGRAGSDLPNSTGIKKPNTDSDRRPAGAWLEAMPTAPSVETGAATSFSVRTWPDEYSGEPAYCDTIRLFLTSQTILDLVPTIGQFYIDNPATQAFRSSNYTGYVIELIRSIGSGLQDPYEDTRNADGTLKVRMFPVKGAYKINVMEVTAGQINTLETFTGTSLDTGDTLGTAAPATLKVIIAYGATAATMLLEYQGEFFTVANTLKTTIANNVARFGLSISNNLFDTNPNRVFNSYIANLQLTWSQAGTTFDKPQSILLAGADGKIYGSGSDDRMELTDEESTVRIATDKQISAAPWLQQLYISDHGRVTEGICGVASSEIEQSSGTPIDFSSFNLDENNHVLVLYDTPDPTEQDGTYTFTLSGTSPQTLTLDDYPRGSPDVTDIADGLARYRIERAPKVYDPTRTGVTAGVTDSDTIEATSKLHRWTATAGLVPGGCPILVSWLGRAVLAGPDYAPHAWFMSRAGVWTDFDYGQEDVGAAVADITFDNGSLGQPITAAVPHTDDYLFFGSAEDISVLVNDPTRNGYMQFLAPIGIVSRTAWAHDPRGNLMFLSRDGLYVIPPGLAQPQPFSKRRLPRSLLDFDPLKADANIVYDYQDEVFHVFVQTLNDSADLFTVNINDGSIWPGQLADITYHPTSAFHYKAFDASRSDVILGCKDGMLRRFERSVARAHDSSTAFDTHCWVGPFQLSPNGDSEGTVLEVSAILPPDSGNVDWSLHVGDSAELAFRADPFDSGTFVPEFNNIRSRVRAKGMAAILKLSTTGGVAWSLETIRMRVKIAGRKR